MRIAIALCFSAVLCTVYARIPKSLDDTQLKIKTAISNLDLTIQQLKRVYADIKENTILAVTKRWWQQTDNYKNYVNLLMDSMRREATNAKFRNIDALYCYYINIWTINDQTNGGYQNAIKCQKVAGKSIQSGLQFLDSLMLLGNQLIKQLNDIVFNCYNDDATTMQSCISGEFSKIDIDVKEFDYDAKFIAYSILPATSYVIVKTTQCISDGYSLARFETQGLMMSNSRCIQNVTEKSNEQSFIGG